MRIMTAWPDFNPPSLAGNGPWGAPEVLAEPSFVASPLPVPKRASPRLKLETATHVRRELARIYREARRGELKPEAATKLAYLLDLLSRIIERSDLEQRVEELEGK